MARTIQRHWASLVLTLLFAVVGTVGVLWPGFSQAQPSETPPPETPEATPAQRPALDATTYLRVQHLRQELGLTNQDLAAAGCTQANAQEVLTHLVAWYQTNQVALDQAEQSAYQAQRTLQDALQRMHVGPPDPGLQAQLPGLTQQVVQAQQQRGQLVASAFPAVTMALSADQQSVLATAQANQDAPLQYRYVPGLTAADIQTLEQNLRHPETPGTPAPGNTAGTFGAISGSWASGSGTSGGGGGASGGEVEQRVLGGRQYAQEAATANLERRLQEVGQAEAAVLAEPEELQVQRQRRQQENLNPAAFPPPPEAAPPEVSPEVSP